MSSKEKRGTTQKKKQKREQTSSQRESPKLHEFEIEHPKSKMLPCSNRCGVARCWVEDNPTYLFRITTRKWNPRRRESEKEGTMKVARKKVREKESKKERNLDGELRRKRNQNSSK